MYTGEINRIKRCKKDSLYSNAHIVLKAFEKGAISIRC